jgi:hypothetical protein
MDAYLISIYMKESGPYTLEQLIKLAKERRVSWGHYFQKIGDSQWRPARDIKEVKEILVKKFAFEEGDTGPSGGTVFFYYSASEKFIMEAAARNFGPVTAKEAEKLCADCRECGYDNWRLPDEDELRTFIVTNFTKHINIGKHETSVLLWTFTKNDGKPCAIVSKDHCETWKPWEHKNDYTGTLRLGDEVKTEESKPLFVRPVRVIKTEPFVSNPTLKKKN